MSLKLLRPPDEIRRYMAEQEFVPMDERRTSIPHIKLMFCVLSLILEKFDPGQLEKYSIILHFCCKYDYLHLLLYHVLSMVYIRSNTLFRSLASL